MSEMATRLSDGQKVKIGSCENMYYCRWDQRKEVSYPYMTTGLHWRLPLPDEDGIKPGDFEDYKILKYDERLRTSFIPYDAMLKESRLTDEDKELMAKNVGIVQTTVKALGLLVNVPCYHGLKLPDSVEGGVKFFWNGKRDALYFSGVINKEKELMVLMECAACGEAWSMPYQDAEPLFRSLRMKLRLLKECVDYWHEHNEGRCPYKAHAMDYRGRVLTIYPVVSGAWEVQPDNREVYCGKWEPALRNFVNLLPGRENRKEKDGGEAGRNEEWNELCSCGEILKEIYLETN